MKKYLILALLLSCFACANDPAVNPMALDKLPSWYLSPKANDSQNLYGAGEGYTVEEASQAALNNLASKLMVSISSESSSLLESNQYGTNEENRQKINQSVEKMTFNNYRVSNSASFNGKVYAEVAVDRSNFIQDRTQKLTELNQKMADLYQGLAPKTILEKRNDLATISDSAIEASSITYILSSLGAHGIDFKKNVNLYNSYQNAYQKVLSQIEFVIEDHDTPKSVASVIITALNRERIKIVKTKNLNNSNLVIIDIKSNSVTQQIYGANVTKLKLDFTLLSNQEKIINSNSLEVSGSSVVSASEATSAAVANLATQISQNGVLKALGINN